MSTALGWRRRRQAARRMRLLACGLCSDSLACDLARWCPASDGPPQHSDRGLGAALDALDDAGLCACWLAPGRKHRAAS